MKAPLLCFAAQPGVITLKGFTPTPSRVISVKWVFQESLAYCLAWSLCAWSVFALELFFFFFIQRKLFLMGTPCDCPGGVT